jgi:hypothetical protein
MKQQGRRVKNTEVSAATTPGDAEPPGTGPTKPNQLKSKHEQLREQLTKAVVARKKTVIQLGKQRTAARDELVRLVLKLLPQYISSFEGKENTIAKDIRQTLRLTPKELTRSKQELKKMLHDPYRQKRLLKTVADLDKALTACAIKGAQLLDKVTSDIHSKSLKEELCQLLEIDKKRKKAILAIKFAGQQLESSIAIDGQRSDKQSNESIKNALRGYTSALRKLGGGQSPDQSVQ